MSTSGTGRRSSPPTSATLDYLQGHCARTLSDAVCETSDDAALDVSQSCTRSSWTARCTFITTQELEDLYPDYTPKERENAFAKEHPTVFLMQIGGKLQDPASPTTAAPPTMTTGRSTATSFSGTASWTVRWSSPPWVSVSTRSLCDRQLTKAGCDDRARSCPSTRCCWTAQLPLTMGGGIGQSPRVHAAAGQGPHRRGAGVSLWDDEHRQPPARRRASRCCKFSIDKQQPIVLLLSSTR